MRLSNGLNRVGLGMLRRFVPIVDFKGIMCAGAEVRFTGYVDCGTGQAAVVRAVRI